MNIFISNKNEPAAAQLLLEGSTLTDQRFGDYVFFSSSQASVGIERKEIMDLIHSMRDGRLDEQMLHLKENFDYPILLVEGKLTESSRSYATTKLGVLDGNDGRPLMRYSRLTNYFLSIWARLGIMTVQVPDFEGTIKTITRMYEWFDKEEHHPFRQQKVAVFGSDTRVDILCQFDGIGPKTARDMLDAFEGNLLAVFTAGEKQLLKIPGLGRKRVAQFLETLGRTV